MQEDNTAIRRYIRQVTGMPIEVSLDYRPDYQADDDTITNISLGGLCFIASDRLEVDESIQVRVPLINPDSSLNGRVVWCNKSTAGYEVGLEFDDPEEVERLKMIEQICQIEKFRQEVERRDGRKLNSEDAAREWITTYAGEFNALN